MSYELEFVPAARREWKKLGSTVRDQFRKKLKQRRYNPHVPSDRMRDAPNCYRIKQRKSGYRLIYEVSDRKLIILVVAIGKRERGEAYEIAIDRLRRRR